MKRSPLVMVGFFTVGLAMMFLYPPYFAVDQTSDGRIHGFLGYHPAWDAPSPERAHAILLEGGILSDSGTQVSDLVVRRNLIRLTLNALILFISFLTISLLLRNRGSKGAPDDGSHVPRRVR